MGGLKGEPIYYEELCAFYEEHFDNSLLVRRLLDLTIHGCLSPHFVDVARYTFWNLDSTSEQNRCLVDVCRDLSDLREETMYLSGYRPRHADIIVDIPGAFHRSGHSNSLRQLSLEEAIKVAAFLDLPISVVNGKTGARPNPLPSIWFQFAPSVDLQRVKQMYQYSVKRQEDWFEAARVTLDNIELLVPEIKEDISVGFAVLHTSNFVEFTITIDESLESYTLPFDKWENILTTAIAEEFGLVDQWGLFVVSDPWLAPSNVKCYRMIYPFNHSDRTRAYVYNRLFSGRTEMFSYLGQQCASPVLNWYSAMRLLRNNWFAQIRYETLERSFQVNELLTEADLIRGIQNREIASLSDAVRNVFSQARNE